MMFVLIRRYNKAKGFQEARTTSQSEQEAFLAESSIVKYANMEMSLRFGNYMAEISPAGTEVPVIFNIFGICA